MKILQPVLFLMCIALATVSLLTTLFAWVGDYSFTVPKIVSAAFTICGIAFIIVFIYLENTHDKRRRGPD